MTRVFHVWLYGRCIEIKSNFRRNKLHKTNQGYIFLGDSFSNRDNVRVSIRFRRERVPASSKTDLHNEFYFHRQYVFLASKVTYDLPVSQLRTDIKDRG